MTVAVPLWAFVALGLAAPIVALVSVMITVGAESRRSHRNWLTQTKYESYERLFGAYRELIDAYGRYLDSPAITEAERDRLKRASRQFKDQFELTTLVASLRVSLAMQEEMMRTWFDIYDQLEVAELGKAAPRSRLESWGDSQETRTAARYDLGVRRDPARWFGAWQDRDHVVRHRYVRNRYRPPKEVISFTVPNRYSEAEAPAEAIHDESRSE